MPSIQEFFEAITTGNTTLVEEMLETQPQLLQVVNEMGDTPVLWAVYHRRQAVVDLLLARGTTLDIFEAAATGDTERVRALLKEDRSLALAYSHDGWTALHLAAFFGNRRCAEALLAAGADVGAVSEGSRFANANTPLHAAVAGGHLTMAQVLLLDADADPNATDGDGHTPLHIAAAGGNRDLVRLLLNAGGDAELSTPEGNTPLMLAREQGHREAVELLKGQG
ncbi:MAG: ankyrin repeat domain-containing protein [Chloroflexi bacterium]|nr:ankyrin repeat domain-containing protein [Chloroflexota bacterium]